MRTISSQRGFTLLGVLFSLSVIVIVISALGLLTVRTVGAGRVSQERFIATALAREGIELVRSLRDDNWFAYPEGTTQIKWRGDPSGTAQERQRAICNGTWVIDIQTQRLVAPSGASQNGELFLSGGSSALIYAHSSGTPTRFRRTVRIRSGGSGTGNCGEVVNAAQPIPPNPIYVSSRVEWRERTSGPFRSIELDEELYDWVRRR